MERLIAGRYRLHGLIARGGMAQVYAATDERLGREVAVKLVQAAENSPEGRQRFVREARAIARLNHPHVVTLFDAGEADGVLYLAMERVAGATLADRVAAGPLDEATATAVVDQLLTALDAAHRAGVVHRDVKPSNVLLDEAGAVKLVDFGIALPLDESAGELTGTGQHIGTPTYMAPEVIAGNPPTPASDLYAVGVLLHLLLTGRPPFAEATPIATAMAHVNAPVPDLRATRPETSPHLAAVVATAMAKDPAARFASAEAMRLALHGRGTPWAPPLEPTQVMPARRRPTGTRSRSGRIAAVAAVAAVAAGVAAAVVVVRSSDDEPGGASATTTQPPPAPTTPSAAAVATTPVPPTTSVVAVATPTTAGTPLAEVETPEELGDLLAATDQYGPRTNDVVQRLERLGRGRRATDRAIELLEEASRWVDAGELDPAVLAALEDVLADIADGPGRGNGPGPGGGPGAGPGPGGPGPGPGPGPDDGPGEDD